jgi:tetratricopeptide (TPR) repeat protein
VIPATAAARFDEALALHERGELAAAERIYRDLLASDAEHFGALLHLGMVELQAGDAQAAESTLGRALAQSPGSGDVHSTLAAALHVQQRFEDAVSEYEQALLLDPDRAETHYGLATSLAALGRAEEAIACYGRALVLDPDYPEASFGLGIALQGMRRHFEAIPRFEAALAVDPDFVEARYGLGVSLQALGRHAAALDCFAAVRTCDPNNLASLLREAEALQALDRHAEAVERYEVAIAKRADVGTILRYGVALREAGRMEAAEREFERALALDPRNSEAYVLLFSLRPVAIGDPHLAAAERLAQGGEALGEPERMNLHFALGKAAASLGNHERSLRHFLAGNALKRTTITYSEASLLDLMARVADVFSADFIAARRTAGHPSSRPVFIVGMPRSGSTLIEQILASHPKVWGGGERSDFGESVIELGADTADAPFPSSIPSLRAAEFRRLGENYLARLEAAVPPNQRRRVERITDKMLENVLMVGLIHIALPHAKIIHACRDPVETCLSCFTTVFANVPYASDLGELGRYYRAYASLMAHWCAVLPENTVLDVRYEEVVRDLESQARGIIAHCGLEWDDACLAFHTNARPVRTASAVQVRQPIYHDAVGRWKTLEPGLLRPLLGALAGHQSAR